MPRGSPTKTEAKPADSSSESEESLDKMAEDLQKGLNKKDADEVKKIVNDIQTAKDPEQTVDSYVRHNFSLCYYIWMHFIKSYTLL